MAAYEPRLVPWFWFLTLFSDCRIFQNKTVPDIVEKVFKDRGFTDFALPVARQLFASATTACSTARPISTSSPGCWKTRASSTSSSRAKTSTCWCWAMPRALSRACPHQARPASCRYRRPLQDEDTVISLEQEFRIHTGNASLTDYDFEKPNTSLFATLPGDRNRRILRLPRQVCHQGRWRPLCPHSAGRAGSTAGDACAAPATAWGSSAATRFTLSDHITATRPTRTITLVCSRASRPQYQLPRPANPDPFEYTNSISKRFRSNVPFRPPRVARKPRRRRRRRRPWWSASPARKSGPTSTAASRCSSSGTARARATKTAPAGSAWPRAGPASSGAPSTRRASARR